jgi:hypothetical protein
LHKEIHLAHFAKLDSNNIVTFVTVGRQEDDGKEAELSARTGDVYKQTSYNTRGGVHYTDGVPSEDQTKAFRKNYAGLGYTYDAGRDAFIPPKPYNSWVLNETTCLWDAPVAMPEDAGTGEPPKRYTWDEDTISWVEVDAA